MCKNGNGNKGNSSSNNNSNNTQSTEREAINIPSVPAEERVNIQKGDDSKKK